MSRFRFSLLLPLPLPLALALALGLGLGLGFGAVLRADPARPAPGGGGGGPAFQPTPEALAGEDGAAPTAQPTPEGDAGGPAMVSRSAQPAPSFALPAFVVMGGGERQDLVNRGDLGSGLDTSGGLKTSPGEKGAGQDQRATEAVRAAPSDETYTPIPRYGELNASYGLGNTLNLDGLLAGEQGPWFGWLEGGGHLDDGGPLPASALEPDQRRDARLAGEGGWRLDPDDLIEASLDGAWRSLRLASALGGAWERREWWGQSLAWERDAEDGLTQRLQLQGREGDLNLPLLQGAAAYSYRQSGADLDYDVERSLDWLLLDLGADLGTLDQRWGGDARTAYTEGLWFEGHVEPWSGARLGLGADLNGVSGGTKAFQLGPRLHFEQGLGPDLGLKLDYGTGLVLSRLDSEALPVDGSASVFETDPLLPNPALRAEREVVDFKAALPWQALAGLSLEPGAFVREDEDAFLPGQAAVPGLWQDGSVGTLLLSGGSLDERYELGPWWQSAQVLGQKPTLSGAPGLVPTFIPDWKGSFSVGWSQGVFSAETGFKLVGPRQASLTGGWTVGTQVDWRLRLGYDFNEHLTFFIEGDSLAGAVVDWPFDVDPSPYLGLGAKLRF